MRPCLINQTACGLIAGNPVCPKCGMDERVVYPGQADREAAQTAGRAQYWETHARELEAAHAAQAVPQPPSSAEVDGPSASAQKLNPEAAWPFATAAGGATADFTTSLDASNSNVDHVPTEEVGDDKAFEELLLKTRKRIRNGWILAAISALLTLGIGVVGPALGLNPMDLDTSSGEHLYMLVDVVLVVVLAFGVYRKNRWAAVALFAYFLVSKITMSLEYGSPRPLIQGSVFGYFYFMAMLACFTWHKRFSSKALWPFPSSNTP